MQMETHKLTVESDKDTHHGEVTVSVVGDSKSEVLRALYHVQRYVETVEEVDPGTVDQAEESDERPVDAGKDMDPVDDADATWTTTDGEEVYPGPEVTVDPAAERPDDSIYPEDAPVHPEARGTGGGVEGMRYRRPDEDVSVIESDDGIVAVEDASGGFRLVRPQNKCYWVLWHFAHYEHTVGEPATNSDIREHYSHVGNVSGSTASLRRAALIEAVYDEDADDPLYNAPYSLTAAGSEYLARHGQPTERVIPDDEV